MAAIIPEPNIEALPPVAIAPITAPSTSTLSRSDVVEPVSEPVSEPEPFVEAPSFDASQMNQGPLTPAPDLETSSVDVSPLSEAVPLKDEVKMGSQKASDPSVIINYDVLGR